MSHVTWEILRTHKAKVPEHVVHRALAHETVLLNVSSSTYHAIDEVGGRFLEAILAAPSVASAAETLAAEYEQPAERISDDMTTFCNDLLERDLIALEAGR